MTGDATFDAALRSGLVWVPEAGMGYFHVKPEDEPYLNGKSAEYWNKYIGYARTPLGEALTRTRVELVTGWTTASIVDIGIGSGAFVEALHAEGRTAYGFDVNPNAVTWLTHRGLWRSPYEAPVEAVSLWDVLEHLPEPAALLRNVRQFVFCSLPIFRDGQHVQASKHFRRDEHRWYWTADGLIRWMGYQGFECVARDSRETDLGREDIGTFVFRRLA